MMAPLPTRRRGFQHRWSASVMFFGLCAVLPVPSVHAGDSSGPWECSNYAGDAHTRCLQAFIEIQREKISQLEAEVHLQQGTVSQLKDQADRQSAVTADLQRQISEQSASVSTYGYVAPGLLYGYPSVGFGLYLGRPWLYGSPFYGRPYAWGPRYYRPYFGRWHRRW